MIDGRSTPPRGHPGCAGASSRQSGATDVVPQERLLGANELVLDGPPGQLVTHEEDHATFEMVLTLHRLGIDAVAAGAAGGLEAEPLEVLRGPHERAVLFPRGAERRVVALRLGEARANVTVVSPSLASSKPDR